MNKQEVMKLQTHTLKVNIDCHCDGCKKKIKKMLKKIEGVYSTTIDAEHGKVTVTGDVDPAKLIKQFEKSGKHAELWGWQRQQISEGWKSTASSDDAANPMKGSKDVKMPPPNKDKKSVKFNLNEEYFDASDDDDDFDDDEFDDEEETGHGHGHGQSHNIPSKTMPVMSNGNGPHGMVGGPGFNDKMGGGGKAKKGGGDGFEIPVAMKGKGDSKDGKGGKKGGGGGDGKNTKSKEENKKQGGKDNKDGKSGIGLGFLGFGRKSRKRRR
ncbi:hypothetical protein OIU84_006696 [Salix udensis]|uniref:HMA domain-containing protein n=1 Tax=Salix udensis TaxID=889485 RepID=A0AAD6JZ24_9ROSI|nr:hypothetical protein OIU84_006696 [Salix udensis]